MGCSLCTGVLRRHTLARVLLAISLALYRNLTAWGHHGSKSALWRHREGKGIANLQTRKSLMGHS